MAVASGAENFKTLVAAVKAAGLVDTLQGQGPFNDGEAGSPGTATLQTDSV